MTMKIEPSKHKICPVDGEIFAYGATEPEPMRCERHKVMLINVTAKDENLTIYINSLQTRTSKTIADTAKKLCITYDRLKELHDIQTEYALKNNMRITEMDKNLSQHIESQYLNDTEAFIYGMILMAGRIIGQVADDIQTAENEDEIP